MPWSRPLAIPSFTNFSQNQRLKAAANALHSDLHHARLEAVNRNGRVTVCPGTAARRCQARPDGAGGWLVFHDRNADQEWQPEEDLLRATPPLAQVQARSSQARTRLTFFPNGSAPGSNATLFLCDGRGPEFGYQVRVSMTGRVVVRSARRDGQIGC